MPDRPSAGRVLMRQEAHDTRPTAGARVWRIARIGLRKALVSACDARDLRAVVLARARALGIQRPIRVLRYLDHCEAAGARSPLVWFWVKGVPGPATPLADAIRLERALAVQTAPAPLATSVQPPITLQRQGRGRQPRSAMVQP